ncbi:type ISP restriction/modification enzyme [Muriicola sp. SD30]|uniref:type ISP restriction/modification enzyme n=1 Tax=Muriicola sp. SD30 TaxID=3240936 RepID=UPI00350F0A8C
MNRWYGSIQADNCCDGIRILKQIKTKLGLTFVSEPEGVGNVCFADSPEVRDDYKQTFGPMDLLDYIYAVLHSPSYREMYKEFLKIDFPEVPYPENAATFWQLVHLGGELRQLHWLESPKVKDYITSYPEDGSNEITTKISKKDWETIFPSSEDSGEAGRIWINQTQYFDKIPLTAWELHFGGCQPAQKWLKDRIGRTLDFGDILDYQKIIVALLETDRIMKKIDALKISLEVGSG